MYIIVIIMIIIIIIIIMIIRAITIQRLFSSWRRCTSWTAQSPRGTPRAYTVSFHNFKSQNFKLSVSNPESKYAAYLSVLSQISNCQGLGRKNKYEILKTDRMYIMDYVMIYRIIVYYSL